MFKAGELGWRVNAQVAVGSQWSEHLQLKQEARGSIAGGSPVFFSSSSWLTNVHLDEVKDL